MIEINNKVIASAILIIVIAAAAGITYYYLTLPEEIEEFGTIKLGVIAAVSGPSAEFGTRISQAAELFVQQINEAGGIEVGGKMYKLQKFIVDTTGNVERGTAAMERLATYHGVDVIVGGQSSSVVLGYMNIPQRDGIPWINAGAQSGKIFRKIANETLDYCFIVSPTSDDLASSDAAVAMHYVDPQKVAILCQDTDAGRDAATAFKRNFQEQSPETQIVYEEFLSYATMPDFYAILAKVKAEEADLIFIQHGSVPACLAFMDTYEELEMDAQVIANAAGFATPTFQDEAGAKANGVIVNMIWIAGSPVTPLSVSFTEDYNAKWGIDPQYIAAQEYDGLLLMMEAIKNAGSLDQAAIKDALETVTLAEGVRGTNLDFQPITGGHRLPVSMVTAQIQDGELVVIWPLSAKEGDYIPPT